MKRRTLGWTGVEFTTVGLGTWAHGGGGWKYSWGPQDDAASIRTIRSALEAGVNWIDTAAVYGHGHSEEVVGAALDGIAERPFTATKCGRVRAPGGEVVSDLSRAGIRAECEASLRRLRAERIDLYQIHWPQPEEKLDEAWDAMAELVREGKIRYAGVSNFSVAQMERLLPIHPIASLQPPYSMLRRDAERELLPFCAAHRIGVVVYSPMQKGLLTGAVTRERVAAFPPDDHRRNDPMFQEPVFSRILEAVNALRPIAQRNGLSPAQLAIAWALRLPEVTSAIVGARAPEQIMETLAAGDAGLSATDTHAIDQVLDALR